MAGLSKDSAPNVQDAGPAVDRSGDLDDTTVNFVTIRESHSLAPLLRGLPGDSCRCPHWGYLLAGKITVSYADREETYQPGYAFYMTPGHVPAAGDAGQLAKLGRGGSAAVGSRASVSRCGQRCRFGRGSSSGSRSGRLGRAGRRPGARPGILAIAVLMARVTLIRARSDADPSGRGRPPSRHPRRPPDPAAAVRMLPRATALITRSCSAPECCWGGASARWRLGKMIAIGLGAAAVGFLIGRLFRTGDT